MQLYVKSFNDQTGNVFRKGEEGYHGDVNKKQVSFTSRDVEAVLKQDANPVRAYEIWKFKNEPIPSAPV